MMPVFVTIIVFYSDKSKDFLRVEGVLPKKNIQLKKKCCEKYKKGKRCKRCPCFDLMAEKN